MQPCAPPVAPVITTCARELVRCSRFLNDEVIKATARKLSAIVYESPSTSVTAYTFDVNIGVLAAAIERANDTLYPNYGIDDSERAELLGAMPDGVTSIIVVVLTNTWGARCITFNDPRAYITVSETSAAQIGYTSVRCVHDRDRVKSSGFIVCIGTTALMSRSMRRRLLSRDLHAQVRNDGTLVAFVRTDMGNSKCGCDCGRDAIDISSVFPRTSRVINCEHLGHESPFVLAVVRARTRARTRLRTRRRTIRPRLCAYLLHEDLLITIRNWTRVWLCGNELCVCDDVNAMWLLPRADTGYINGVADDRHIANGKLLATARNYL